MGLAVGDDFFVRRDAQLFEDLRHVLADAQVARRVHAGSPFEIDRAGNVPASGCDDFLAGVFQRAASVPDRQVGSTETALQVLTGGGGRFVQCQADRACDGCRHFDGHRQAFVQPRQQTTVEVVVVRVADHVQQPDKPPGPAAAFIVIDHVDRIRVVPELAEQGFQVGFGRQQARRRRLAELGTLGVDEACAGDMAGAVAGGAGQVHQNQFAGVEARQQLARLDHQRQAREVRHVRSPGAQREKIVASSAAAVGKGMQGPFDALHGFAEGLHGDVRERPAALVHRH
ncbi:hypothetical protein D3C78_1162460 [compost metagenome]